MKMPIDGPSLYVDGCKLCPHDCAGFTMTGCVYVGGGGSGEEEKKGRRHLYLLTGPSLSNMLNRAEEIRREDIQY